MPRLSLSLSQKTLLLIAVPIVFQILFFTFLLKIDERAEAETAAAEHARDFTERINKLQRDLYDIAGTFGAADFATLDKVAYLECKGKLELDFQELKAVSNSEEERKIIDNVVAAGEEGIRTIEQGIADEAAGQLPDHSDRRANLFKTLRRVLLGALNDTVLNMAKRQRDYMRSSPERQASNRQLGREVLIGGVVGSVLLSIILAVFISRSIIKRLNVITDNSFRLARDAPLNPPMKGNDEISNLDHVFHELADALTNAIRKERATIEHARDVIFTLDAKGTFVSVSPAADKVFGYSATQLLGSKFVLLLDPVRAQDTLHDFKDIMEGVTDRQIETLMIRQDGRALDVVISATWSPLENSMFCIAHDVTERKNAERLRQEVLAMVSHDLRTPLATVRSFLEMLEAGMFGELTERGVQLLGLADRSSGRMMTLIRDLLEIEKMESGMLQLTKEDVSVQTLFEQTIHGLSTAASQAGVFLQSEPTNLLIHADGDRMVQILTNLAGNAIKFSPPDGIIKLTAATIPGAIEIKVIDQGRGVPASMRKTIFERFKQVEKADSKEKGGSGLGLAICKALVEMHDGEIGVNSVDGKGSVFYFRIPTTASDRVAVASG